MEIGKKQVLKVVRRVGFGVYLGDGQEEVLLPRAQVPEGTKAGDALEVFLYRDSADRPIATTHSPRLTLGETAFLQVAQTGKVGAFLDWGLEKDLLLPFKEQTVPVAQGDTCLVALYLDRSGRLCATMKVHPYLSPESPYGKGDRVEAYVYQLSQDLGAFAAVEGRYSGQIPRRELVGDLPVGSRVQARVTQVRPDGRLELSLREAIPLQMEKDGAKIREALEQNGGRLPFTEKASPEEIRARLGMTKAAFKRALGRLIREGEVSSGPEGIQRIEK